MARTLFSRAPAVETRGDHPTNSLWELLRRRIGSDAEVPQDENSLLTHSAVYQCVALISDLVAGCYPYRYRLEDGRRLDRQYGPSPIIDNPSTDIDALNWRTVLVASWLLRGWQPGIVTVNSSGRATGVEFIAHERVDAWRNRPDDPWQYRLDRRTVPRWPLGELFIGQGRMFAPTDPFGMSVLGYAARAAGLGLAARRFGAEFFTAGSHPTALLRNTDPNAIYDKDGAAEVRDEFEEAVRARRTAVLSGPWEYNQVQVSPEDSQFLELIGANRTEVSGFFCVPPGLIGAPAGTNNMVYQNVEASGIHLVRHTLGVWVRRTQSTLSAFLPRSEFVRLDTEEIERGDMLTRNRADDIMIRNGTDSPNEVRARRGQAPFDGGDRRVWPPGRSNLTQAELEGSEGTADSEDQTA